MSKILDASCDASGKVTCEGVEIPTATVLSEGKKASTGVMLLDGSKARYVTSSATDIKDLITSLVEIVNQTAVILSAIDGTLGGSNSAAIAQLQVYKTQLDASKDTLK